MRFFVSTLWASLQTGIFWLTRLNQVAARASSHIFEIYNAPLIARNVMIPTPPLKVSCDTNDSRIKWTRQVKAGLQKTGINRNYEDSHFRIALYRPFIQKYLYFDNFWNEERYQQYRIFPTPKTEMENRVICVAGLVKKRLWFLITNIIRYLRFSL